MYAELSYFDGYAFAHIAAWQEAKRLAYIIKRDLALIGARR